MSSKKRFLGRNARLHIGTSWSEPSWTRVDTRDTLAVILGGTRENVTAEDSDGWQWEQEILQTIGLEFSAFYLSAGIGDATYSALETAKSSGTPVVVAVSDGDIATPGTKYRKMELYVGELRDERNVQGAGKITVSMYQGPANNPTTVTVPSET